MRYDHDQPANIGRILAALPTGPAPGAPKVKPLHIYEAIALVGNSTAGWQIPGTLWFAVADPNNDPDAWYTSFLGQLRLAQHRVTPRK